MGSGGSGSSGGSSGSGGSPAGGGWGPTMGSGGNAYGRGGVGGIGTAGTMSSGAGGSAMGGFGNTGAGGSGMAGISTHSGETPAGFTPAYGDARGLALGMNANGTYGGPGIRENGQTVYGYRKSINPVTKQVQYRTIIQRITPSKTPGFGYNQWGNLVKLNTALPTTTNSLMVNKPQLTMQPPTPFAMTRPGLPPRGMPGQTPRASDFGAFRAPPGLQAPSRGMGPLGTNMGAPGGTFGADQGIRGDMGANMGGYMGNTMGNAPGSGSTGGPNRGAKGGYGGGSSRGGFGP